MTKFRLLRLIRRCGPALLAATSVLLTVPIASGAQSTAPVIDLPGATAHSKASFGSILNLVELASGEVVINDAATRRLIVLDHPLAEQKILLDSALTQSSYGRDAVPLVLCNCREVWFPDRQSASLLAFKDAGPVSRVMAAPRPSDLQSVSRGRGMADTIGNLVYPLVRASAVPPANASQPMSGGLHPDTILLFRTNFETRKVDTLAHLRAKRLPWGHMGGAFVSGAPPPPIRITFDILPPLDEWTVTADGTVAVVRGHDYHIDWYMPNGRTVSSPKLPFAFKRLDDGEKAALRDSAIKAALAEDKARAEVLIAKGGIRISLPSGEQLPNYNPPYVVPIVDSISFEMIPDYYPPLRSGAVTSDFNGNVWILPTVSELSQHGELVYDVVNRERGLIARVRAPVGRSIAGFGSNGAVYLIGRESNGQWFVERTVLPKQL